MIPFVALISIDFSKGMIGKLTSLTFNFLLIILGCSCLYVILISHIFARSAGIFVSYYINTGHYGLSLIILSVFYYFISPQKKLKSILGVGLGLFTILISSARSPILAAAVLVMIMFFYINKLKYWLALLSFVIIFIISIYYLRHSLLSTEYIVRIYDAIFEGNAYGRSQYLSKGWDIFKSNPLFGGATLFEDGMYPHNIFVEVLMSMGIIGLISFGLYFKDLGKFKLRYIKENIYYLPYFLFFAQYLVLVQTSYCIFANIEFWCFSAVIISIILFCYDEKIKSDDSRGYATGDH
ncbi:O-antigen ligase family protein [Chryseobacterium sp. RP-3-3]|uniref:O-antigen ligase family protein n=1 Tax=Chryseobacterium antibioticum TaxID=2728847 RepID=A0A7Y0AND4_9FLAO|nr:O-antigen ligase family protein [Chryseobacterium antibioticum]NML70479.1 O-antigen ligase family protein [Chryseobacterium antibioticum]